MKFVKINSSNITSALLLLLIVLVAFNFKPTPGKKSNVGHINTVALWNIIPEKQEADSLITVEKGQLEAYFKQLNDEFNGILAEVRDTTNVLTDFIRQEKVKKLESLQKEIVEFKESGEARLASSKETYYKPIREKMQKAIDAVAAENGYDYILDSSFGNIIYVKNESDNILELVKKKLNL